MKIFITTIGMYEIYFEDLTQQAREQNPWNIETFDQIKQLTTNLFAAYREKAPQGDTIQEITSQRGRTERGAIIQADFYPAFGATQTVHEIFLELKALIEPLEDAPLPPPLREQSPPPRPPATPIPLPPPESPPLATRPVTQPTPAIAATAEQEEEPFRFEILSTELDLKQINLPLPARNAPLPELERWYERIPPRTRLRICRHIAINYDTLFPIERTARTYLTNSGKNVREEIRTLERETDTRSNTAFEILIRDYYLYLIGRPPHFQERIKTHYTTLSLTPDFQHYFEEQLRAQHMRDPTEQIWQPLHYSCFIHALERFLDNPVRSFSP